MFFYVLRNEAVIYISTDGLVVYIYLLDGLKTNDHFIRISED